MHGTQDRVGIGLVVTLSVVTGLATAAFLVLAPFVPAEEHVVTGVTLLGFALGWAVLAWLSTSVTSQPQRWAWAPAAFMAVGGGIVLLAPDTWLDEAVAWVWPPALLVLVAWMFRRARHDLRSRSRVLLVYPVLAVLLVFAVGGAYEQLASTQDVDVAMPGQRVDVGDHSLHVACTGSGEPTVVLEPGAGEMSAYDAWVARGVAHHTRVCVYDRAGRGWSDPASATQDATQIATDLHALLHGAQVPGPYVLAGHSFGGLYVMTFAAQYPDEVAGLVLIDSTAPSTEPVPAEDSGSYDLSERVAAVAAATTRLGVGHALAQTSYSTLPPTAEDVARTSGATADQAASTIEEYAAASRSAPEAGQLTTLGAEPLVVLTAGSGSQEGWMTDQDDMATLSTNSVHRVVPGATHTSLMEHEEDAAAVTSAILDVVTAAQTSRPLPSE